MCGDRRADKARAAELSSASRACAASTPGGWRWRAITEQLTALMISINARYKVHAGVRIAGLPEHHEAWPAPSSS